MATALYSAESSSSLLETVEFWSRESSASISFELTNEEATIDGAVDVVVVKESLDDGVTDLLNRDGLRGAY